MLGSPRDKSHLRFHVAQALRRLQLVDSRAFNGHMASRETLEGALQNMMKALREFSEHGKSFDAEALESSLREVEAVIDKGLHYPFDSVPLVTEYHNSVQRQRRAFIAEKGVGHPAASSPTGTDHQSRPYLHNIPTRTIDAPGGMCLTPAYSDDTVQYWLEDHTPSRICFVNDTIVTTTLFNPLPIFVDCVCDFCSAPSHVCWHAVEDLNNRDFDLNSGSISLDACLPCAVHYLQLGSDELRAFINAPIPTDKLVDGFAHLHLEREMASNARCRLLHGYREATEIVFSVGVAPRGSHPIAWIASGVQLGPEVGDAQLLHHLRGDIAASVGAVDILFGVTLERQQSELSGMGPRAQSQLLGCCTICLEELHPSNGDCSQTRCNHWFHDRCLQQLRHSCAAKQVPFLCPLCRSNESEAEPQSPEAVAKSNVYSVVVDLEKLRAKLSGGRAVVVVADVCSIDGKILTAADIGAAVKIGFDIGSAASA